MILFMSDVDTEPIALRSWIEDPLDGCPRRGG